MSGSLHNLKHLHPISHSHTTFGTVWELLVTALKLLTTILADLSCVLQNRDRNKSFKKKSSFSQLCLPPPKKKKDKDMLQPFQGE